MNAVVYGHEKTLTLLLVEVKDDQALNKVIFLLTILIAMKKKNIL